MAQAQLLNNEVVDLARTELAATLRVLGAQGLQYGLAGHATVRLPGEQELYLVNPASIPFAEVRAEDVVLLDGEGVVIDGIHEAHGYQGQVEVHRARPDLRAGLHLHSTHTFAWSSAGGAVSPLTTDSSWLHGIQAVRDSFDVPAAQALGPTARILVQRSHGAVSFGATVAEAAFYLISLERAAYTQLLLEAAGRAREIDASLLETWRLSPEAAHRQFQPQIETELRRSAAAR